MTFVTKSVSFIINSNNISPKFSSLILVQFHFLLLANKVVGGQDGVGLELGLLWSEVFRFEIK
jgi:hypothetical protein